MGRRRQFDEDTVLSSVMHAFRRGGYAGVSMRELEGAASLSAGSLYHAYGGKQGLFEAAFEHYNAEVLQWRIQHFAPEGSGTDGLRELFTSLLHEPDGTRAGCLITNSAVEFGPQAPPQVGAAFAVLEDAFAERLRTSVGASWSEVDVQLWATRLLALYQGVLVMVRGGHDLTVVERMIVSVFDDLSRRESTR